MLKSSTLLYFSIFTNKRDFFAERSRFCCWWTKKPFHVIQMRRRQKGKTTYFRQRKFLTERCHVFRDIYKKDIFFLFFSDFSLSTPFLLLPRHFVLLKKIAFDSSWKLHSWKFYIRFKAQKGLLKNDLNFVHNKLYNHSALKPRLF